MKESKGERSGDLAGHERTVRFEITLFPKHEFNQYNLTLFIYSNYKSVRSGVLSLIKYLE